MPFQYNQSNPVKRRGQKKTLAPPFSHALDGWRLHPLHAHVDLLKELMDFVGKCRYSKFWRRFLAPFAADDLRKAVVRHSLLCQMDWAWDRTLQTAQDTEVPGEITRAFERDMCCARRGFNAVRKDRQTGWFIVKCWHPLDTDRLYYFSTPSFAGAPGYCQDGNTPLRPFVSDRVTVPEVPWFVHCNWEPSPDEEPETWEDRIILQTKDIDLFRQIRRSS